MDSHDHFLSLFAAPQDVSLPVLEELLREGYTEGRWVKSPSATDDKCIFMDTQSWSLEEFLEGPGGYGLQHAAPFYERTHVGCHCTLVVTGPGLPEVVVNAFGRQ